MLNEHNKCPQKCRKIFEKQQLQMVLLLNDIPCQIQSHNVASHNWMSPKALISELKRTKAHVFRLVSVGDIFLSNKLCWFPKISKYPLHF